MKYSEMSKEQLLEARQAVKERLSLLGEKYNSGSNNISAHTDIGDYIYGCYAEIGYLTKLIKNFN